MAKPHGGSYTKNESYGLELCKFSCISVCESNHAKIFCHKYDS